MWDLGSQHSASGLVFRVTKIANEDWNEHWAEGTYLSRAEHPAVNRETPTDTTMAPVQWMAENAVQFDDQDARRFLKVDVTQKDIDKGECGTPWSCAVAMALDRAVRKRFRRWKGVRAGVGTRTCDVSHDRQLAAILVDHLPAQVTEFVIAFDRGVDHHAELKPFTFWIPLSEKVLGRPRR